MRIELSDPIPGLLMALPLIAILMTAGRSPIALRQRPSPESESTIGASQRSTMRIIRRCVRPRLYCAAMG
jgi:hypothetical protein